VLTLNLTGQARIPSSYVERQVYRDVKSAVSGSVVGERRSTHLCKPSNSHHGSLTQKVVPSKPHENSIKFYQIRSKSMKINENLSNSIKFDHSMKFYQIPSNSIKFNKILSESINFSNTGPIKLKGLIKFHQFRSNSIKFDQILSSSIKVYQNPLKSIRIEQNPSESINLSET
jgi:hypothetical protein